MGAIRTQLSLDPCLRELAICAVAVATDAAYEWSQHAPEFLAAGGSQAQLDALQGDKPSANTQAFDATGRAVIALAQAMTRDVRVDDAVFAAMQALLPDPQQQVELVGVIASYNMVSRFLVALQVPMEADMPGASASASA
jgi:alkylhydroperoxidase family enzyme